MDYSIVSVLYRIPYLQLRHGLNADNEEKSFPIADYITILPWRKAICNIAFFCIVCNSLP